MKQPIIVLVMGLLVFGCSDPGLIGDGGDQVGADSNNQAGVDGGDQTGADGGDQIGVDSSDQTGADGDDQVGIDGGDQVGVDSGDPTTGMDGGDPTGADTSDRPALDNTIDEDRRNNEEEIAWAECGHPPSGDDAPYDNIDNGQAAWPQGVNIDADGTIHAGFTTIHPVDSDASADSGIGHLPEFCARRTNYYRAYEGLEPYVLYIEKTLDSMEDAQECMREGPDCRHRTTRAQPDSQNAIGGEDAGPFGFNWLPHLNFVTEGQQQGYHYGAQSWTQPRLLSCVSYREDGGNRNFQNFWDTPPSRRLEGFTEPGFFVDAPTPQAGSMKALAVATGGNHTCALLEGGEVTCWGDGIWGQLGDSAGASTDGVWMHGRTVPGTPVALSGPARMLASGHNHACALLESGGVECWGHDESSQLGAGNWKGHHREYDQHRAYSPVAVDDVPEEGDPVVAIAAAMRATCLTFESGAVRCFGAAIDGVTGRGPSNGDDWTPWHEFSAVNDGDNSDNLENLTGLHLGTGHGCGLTTAGGVQCWGRDYRGQLGDGERQTDFLSGAYPDEPDADDPRIPRDVVGLRGGVERVATGAEHTCAILTNGSVKCWGSNRYNQLGYDGMYYQVDEDIHTEHERAPELEATPVDICLHRPAIDLALGGAHSCALLDDGTVWCWGSSNHGKLGNGNYNHDSMTPVLVGLENVVDIDARHMHTCAVTADGKLYCWGLNYYGQLGTGDTVDQAEPQLVLGF